MADTWKAFTDLQALKELAGLRGVSPSVRFLEKIPQGTSKQKVYHVRQNELIYLWGVEMFQGATDCVTIDKIETNGTLTRIKNGGQSIDTFISQDKMQYGFGVCEYPPFNDFWEDPYLVNYTSTNTNKDTKKIVKSNFFRTFYFQQEGYYKISLDERLNPLTGSLGFVANFNDDQYLPLQNYFSRSFFNGMKLKHSDNTQSDNPFNSISDNVGAAPIQSSRTEGEFKREIIIRVIANNKDIVTTNLINGTGARRNITFTSGYNSGDRVTATNVDGKITFGAMNIQGGNSHFASREYFRPVELSSLSGTTRMFIPYTAGNNSSDGIDTWNTLFWTGGNSDSTAIQIKNSDLEFLYEDSDMEYAPFHRDLYVGGKLNNGSATDNINRNGTTFNFAQSTTSDVRKIRTINARNSVIENINIYANEFGLGSGEPNFLGPNPWWILQNSLGAYAPTGRNYVISSVVDFSGSVFKNCMFEGMTFNPLGVFTDSNSKSFIIDGCTFENCTFRGSNVLQGINGVGILIKNCKFEKTPKQCTASDDLLRAYECESTCFMGCTVEKQGRFFEMIANGPFINNIMIRCSDKKRSSQGQAGEGVTVDASNPNNIQYGNAEGFSTSERIRTAQYNNNIFIMNNSLLSSGNGLWMHSFVAKGKFNLSAFTTSTYDNGFYLYGRKRIDGTFIDLDQDIWWMYNVYMHNYVFGASGQIKLRPCVHQNRFLNCVWENPGYIGQSWGNFSQNSTTDSENPQFLFFNDVNPSTETTSDFINATPAKNLFNNCAIVNYSETSKTQANKLNTWWQNEFNNPYAFYGARAATIGTGFSSNLNYFKFADDLNQRGSYSFTPAWGSPPIRSGGYAYNRNSSSLSPPPSTIFPNNETDSQLQERLSGKTGETQPNGENVIHNLTKIGERHIHG